MVEIQRDESIIPTEDRQNQLEDAVERILDFNRNCKRRKGKRRDSEHDGDAEEPSLL